MPNPVGKYKRSKLQKQLDIMRVVELLSKGWTQQMIANELGICQQQVSKDWQVACIGLQKERTLRTAYRIEELTAQYARIKVEAWKQWERSMKPIKRTEVEEEPIRDCPMCNGTKKEHRRLGGILSSYPCRMCQGKGHLGGVIKVKKIKGGRIGDTNYLRIIKECMEEETKLEGLYPEQKIKLGISGAIGHMRVGIDWDQVAKTLDEELPDEVEERLRKKLPPGIISLPELGKGGNGATSKNGH